MLIPGPNVALIVANSVAYGTRFGLLTVAGTATAMVLQLAVTALGHGGGAGHARRMAGMAALGGRGLSVLLGVRQWRAAPVDLTRTRPRAAFGRAASSCAGCWCR